MKSFDFEKSRPGKSVGVGGQRFSPNDKRRVKNFQVFITDKLRELESDRGSQLHH